ncbi:MAG: M23 family metallopeptidase [Alphaproteobacteria bacterium]|nr:M23 family metallopeptidase [Alphaproteobacteria bacterium]
MPAAAEPLSLSGSLAQGGLTIGQTAPGASVALDGRPVPVDGQGRFLLGFGRDAPSTASLDVTLPSGERLRRELAVTQRQYDIQRIDGLPPTQVTPPPEEMARIRAEAALVQAARGEASERAGFASGFVWPATGPISGVYGSQRILNGEPRRPHVGVDVAAPAGTPVVATADATVALAHTAMYFAGGIVILDHGHGLTSSYLHLSRVDVARGQAVGRGEPIGAIGATGRVTGAHLHWQFNLFDMALDAMLIVGPMPEEPLNPASADAATTTGPVAPVSTPPAHR